MAPCEFTGKRGFWGFFNYQSDQTPLSGGTLTPVEYAVENPVFWGYHSVSRTQIDVALRAPVRLCRTFP